MPAYALRNENVRLGRWNCAVTLTLAGFVETTEMRAVTACALTFEKDATAAEIRKSLMQLRMMAGELLNRTSWQIGLAGKNYHPNTLTRSQMSLAEPNRTTLTFDGPTVNTSLTPATTQN